MRPVQIITDSCSDLPVSLQQEHNIKVIPLSYIIGEKVYSDDSFAATTSADFYNSMRSGAAPTTSQVTVAEFIQVFTESIQAGYDPLYIAFSSALSGTFNASVMAKNTIKQQFPDANIVVIDSLSASLGLGLLVLEAVHCRDNGQSLADITAHIENQKQYLNHWFTVGDLEYLRRGGRISSFASTVGSILQVKPILRVDDAGRLVPTSKVRGRKKSIDELARICCERIETSTEQVIAISHGDCETDAKLLEEQVRAKVPIKQCIIRAVGPVIGSHSGPETLALFFWGLGRS